MGEDESYYSGSAGSLRPGRFGEGELDPMASVANLSDAMLVFACGLLIALVVAWNVDISTVTEVELDQSQKIDDIENFEGELNGSGTTYVQRGTVYQDPNTGTMYLLEDTAEGDGSSDGDSGQ